MNPVCGIVTTLPNSSSSNLLQWDAPECVPGCDVCHNTIQVSDEQWKYLAAMHPDQRLRSLALRLLDTAQTLAEQRAEPLRAVIESADATNEERFEALAQLATLPQEIPP